MKEFIKKALSDKSKKKIADKYFKKAAVLLILYNKDGNYYTLLTKRSDKLPYHKAQISLPGGAYKESDISLMNTALRETSEEIGLNTENIEILGELSDITTLTSNFIVSPFVAFISYPFILKINRDEIDEIIELPVSFIISNENLKKGIWKIERKEKEGFYYVYNGHIIWGATAKILKEFSDILLLVK